MTTLESKDIKRFRAIGHKLKPVVMISDNGLSAAVLAELDRSLEDHELIKVKVPAGPKTAKSALTANISKETGAQCVQSIGNTVLLFRAAKQANPRLSNLRRRLT